MVRPESEPRCVTPSRVPRLEGAASMGLLASRVRRRCEGRRVPRRGCSRVPDGREVERVRAVQCEGRFGQSSNHGTVVQSSKTLGNKGFSAGLDGKP